MVGEFEYEVDQFMDRFVVHLGKRVCSCGMFQLCGYPYAHACAAISSERQNLEDFVDDWYKKDTYLKVYAKIIHVVPKMKEYIKTPYEPLKLSQLKKPRGRPKKMRRRGPDEIQNTSTRKDLTHTCKNCMKIDHNKKGCKNRTHPNSKFYKVLRTVDELATQGSQCPQPYQEPIVRGPATVDDLPTQGYQGPQTSQKLVTKQEVAETQEISQQNQGITPSSDISCKE
ncbi:hypothetical protein Sango_0080900 [Sesamum angolense]|uniref:Zinc finger PMZ-type domain-containing protein n=1 Tax=Sesamum angolense TaxID=2727404 RepID=A0AAE1XE81_9LAMI|nr:hypothetical protein Sango_0080900 [Sesamum angolense]